MNNCLTNITEIDHTDIATSFICQTDQLSSLITIQSSDFTVVSQNIRSIYANLDDLRLNMCKFNFEIDVIILSECRLDSNKNIPQIENYLSFYTTKHLNKADGVVAYIKNTHKASFKELILTHASGLQVDIENLTIIGIYRSPSTANADDFINSLNLYLNTITRNKNIILTGDININLIYYPDESTQGRSNRINYLNMLATHGMLPGHVLPTRGQNCLDHFIIRLDTCKKSAKIAVIESTVTDHFLIFLKISCFNRIHVNKKIKEVINYDSALLQLKSENLNDLLALTDPDLIAQGLITTLQKSLALNTTTITTPRKEQFLKPWMTAGVLRCIRNRNVLQRKLKLDPENQTLKVTYKRYRNFCTKIIRKLKRDYDRSQLENAIKNPKKLWNIINNITQRRTPKSQNQELLKIEPTPEQSLDKVNTYFATIGELLAQNISTPRAETGSDASMPLVTSFVLLSTDPGEVHTIVMSMKTDSAPGWDKIPVRFVKLANKEIVPILVHLINRCFECGIFPAALKQTIITPVHKSGEKKEPSNFRPISVISVVAKILEKLINIRLQNFFSKYKMLSKSQYGFRKNLSTEDAVLALTSTIVENVDAGNKCLAVFLDLKKAFDTVSVPILLRSLQDAGIRGNPFKLLESYLTDRSSRVGVGSILSSKRVVNYGVPQGSVLGPTLFLVYINSLCNMQVDGGSIYTYADDTAIVYAAENWEKLKSITEAGLVKIAIWLNTHLLSLNVKKSNYVCFSKYDSGQPSLDFRINVHQCEKSMNSCSCSELKKVTCIKYLGVMLDQRLSWHSHIELLLNRTRKLIWTFKTLRHVASERLLRLTYLSLAQSVMTYCITVWGGANKTRFVYLERAQRSLLKVMYFLPREFSTNLLYSSTNLLTIRKLYILSTVLSKHKSLPYQHSVNNDRRKRNVVHQPRVKSVFAQRQYVNRANVLYNKINKELDIYNMTYKRCKFALTKWLKTKSYDEIEVILSQ